MFVGVARAAHHAWPSSCNVLSWCDVAGVAILGKWKSGRCYVAQYYRGLTDWAKIKELMRDDLRERVSEDPLHIPWRSVFSDRPKLPIVEWEMGAFLKHESAPSRMPLRAGSNESMRWAFEYISNGQTHYGWAMDSKISGPTIAAYCLHDPTVFAQVLSSFSL